MPILIGMTEDKAEMPRPFLLSFNATIVSNKDNTINDVIDIESIREAMWRDITRKNIWEGYVEIKKSMLKDAAEHRGYSQNSLDEVWGHCVANSSAYKKSRVSYLLDAFSFEGDHLMLATDFANKEEQVVYAICEHIKASH